MGATPFTAILAGFLTRVPGAYAVSLVDREGETVDYAGVVDPFDVKVAAAHVRIVLHELERLGALGQPRWMVVRGARKSIVARALPDAYALVVLLKRRAGFTASWRAFDACARALAEEAGWGRDAKRSWYAVEVVTDRRGRPRRLRPHDSRGKSVAVEVLGSLVGLPPREHGFRVRTAAGSEMTLVREAQRCWYSDEPLTLP